MPAVIEIHDPQTGEPRKLGTLPLPEPGKTKYTWGVFGDTLGSPDLLTDAELDALGEVDLSRWASPTKDQDGEGACNPFCTTNCNEATRRFAGITPEVLLSPGDVYYRIASGDNGSMLEDALAELLHNGQATAETVPELIWKTQGGRLRPDQLTKAKQERALYRFLEAWHLPTWRHALSAIARGFFVNCGIPWYDTDALNAAGWLPASGRGGGGHSIMGCGISRRTSGTKYGVKFKQTWGDRWYPQFQNCGVIPQERGEDGMGSFGWWAVRAVVEPTDDPDRPPTPG